MGVVGVVVVVVFVVVVYVCRKGDRTIGIAVQKYWKFVLKEKSLGLSQFYVYYVIFGWDLNN